VINVLDIGALILCLAFCYY